jgi:hypothetical protein
MANIRGALSSLVVRIARALGASTIQGDFVLWDRTTRRGLCRRLEASSLLWDFVGGNWIYHKRQIGIVWKIFNQSHARSAMPGNGISRSKFDRLPRTTAGFTTRALGGTGLRDH